MSKKKKIILLIMVILFLSQTQSKYTPNYVDDVLKLEERHTGSFVSEGISKEYETISIEGNYKVHTFLTSHKSVNEAKNHQELKSVIYEELQNRNPDFSIKYTGDVNDPNNFQTMLKDAIQEVLDSDHYIMYNVDNFSTNIEYQIIGEHNGLEPLIIVPMNVKVEIRYRTTKEQEDYVTKRVNEILPQIIEDDMSDEAKIKAVHDYIINNLEYDHSLSNYTAYDALHNGKAVCQGYSLLGYRMLNEIGIPTRIISSEAMNHGWNLVKIGGQWKHLDLTWDDPVTNVEGGILTYNHFLLTDEEIIDVDKNEDPIRSWTSEEYPSSGEGFVGLNDDDYVKLEEVPNKGEDSEEEDNKEAQTSTRNVKDFTINILISGLVILTVGFIVIVTNK